MINLHNSLALYKHWFIFSLNFFISFLFYRQRTRQSEKKIFSFDYSQLFATAPGQGLKLGARNPVQISQVNVRDPLIEYVPAASNTLYYYYCLCAIYYYASLLLITNPFLMELGWNWNSEWDTDNVMWTSQLNHCAKHHSETRFLIQSWTFMLLKIFCNSKILVPFTDTSKIF